MSLQLYRSRVLEQASVLLSHLDREPFSPSCGSFDRFHWAWGAIDVSNADFQRFALPLAYLYALDFPNNPYYRNHRLLDWVEAAVMFSCRERRLNGSFTQFYPNDHCIVSAGWVVHDLIAVAELLEKDLSKEIRSALEDTAESAGRFLLRHEERHGFNSNHQLAIAAGLLDIFAWTQGGRFRTRAHSLIDRVIARQMRSGAFLEYAGADPGYHTLGLAFLAACIQRCPDETMVAALRRGIEFSSHFLSPISGSGGCYGSRGTRLLFPSGFEIGATLGIRPDLTSLVAEIIRGNRCVTSRNTDILNLIPILSDYTRACLSAGERLAGPSPTPPASATEDFFCQESTLFSFARGDCRIRGRLNGGMLEVERTSLGRLIFSSAGYFVRSRDAVGFTGVLDGEWNRDNAVMTFRSLAQRPNRVRQRPLLFLCLRIYQLLVGNFMPANLLLKRCLAWLLMFRRRYLTIELTRTIRFEPACLVIVDQLQNRGKSKALVRHCAEGYISFMGSARYFDCGMHDSGDVMDVTLQVLGDGVPRGSVNDPNREWEIRPGGSLEITWSIACSREEAHQSRAMGEG